jgi:DNA-damage-inducible protein J
MGRPHGVATWRLGDLSTPQSVQKRALHAKAMGELLRGRNRQQGVTISDAVRILLTRVAREGALPAGLAVDPDAYDAWFRAKVQEALADTRPPIQHSEVMNEARALIDKKRRARSPSSDRSAPRRG